jgi:hypothetical protein
LVKLKLGLAPIGLATINSDPMSITARNMPTHRIAMLFNISINFKQLA